MCVGVAGTMWARPARGAEASAKGSLRLRGFSAGEAKGDASAAGITTASGADSTAALAGVVVVVVGKLVGLSVVVLALVLVVVAGVVLLNVVEGPLVVVVLGGTVDVLVEVVSLTFEIDSLSTEDFSCALSLAFSPLSSLVSSSSGVATVEGGGRVLGVGVGVDVVVEDDAGVSPPSSTGLDSVRYAEELVRLRVA